ncbi:hypothetical protein BDR05DRAFT_965775 [Suillus weaverae]|nr:hypothetical protein BDR05DRAFT_965775 [Suillus weaverae]
MLRWLLVTLALAVSVLVFTNPLKFQREPSDALSWQCRAHAWVRAPDMVPGDVIAGDVRIKLNGPCADAESYGLGLRYKEKIFWRLSPQTKYTNIDSTLDAFRHRMPFQNFGNPIYNEMQFRALEWQDKSLPRSVHEEERIAFEIKTPLVGAKGGGPLPRSFTSPFGILVPNTNYPPGLDYRRSVWRYIGNADAIYSESIYEYFVEIRFSNGTISEIPAGVTAFTPFHLSTEDEISSFNVSLAPAGLSSNSQPCKRSVDRLRSNYTVEVSFPEGAHIDQNSSLNIKATVHRTGYTNRTDIPAELCAFPASSAEWHPQELKSRSQTFTPFLEALVPSIVSSMVPSMEQSRRFPVPPPPSHSLCREIKFAVAPSNLTHEGHISSTSSEPLSLSLPLGHNFVHEFSTYYQTLGHRVILDLRVKPDPSEPWEHEFEKERWERQTAGMDETDFDWVPWLSPVQTRRRYLDGHARLPVVPMQNQRPVPAHYLSDEARQPAFVSVSDIADLRSMTPQERDLLTPFTQPFIRVFAKGEELLNRYFTDCIGQPIYVGDTWLNKVLSVAAEG